MKRLVQLPPRGKPKMARLVQFSPRGAEIAHIFIPPELPRRLFFHFTLPNALFSLLFFGICREDVRGGARMCYNRKKRMARRYKRYNP